MSGTDDFDGKWNRELENLYVSAIAIYGMRQMWNANPSRSIEGMRMIARRLRTYGGSEEWRYAARILRAIESAKDAALSPSRPTKH